MSAWVADPVPGARVQVSARGIGFAFGANCGIVADFTVQDQGRSISMMHKAPWARLRTRIVLPTGAPPHQAYLEGDFFCAPFSDASIDGAPLHGWPANGIWQLERAEAKTIHYTLDHAVMGARVTKTLSLTDDHPFLYQRHIFTGGQGAVSVANHAMISLPNGGLLGFSPKRWFETPADAPETDPARGRSCLHYPAQSTDPKTFPGRNGTTTDLTCYPFGPAHEDFVIGLEAPESPLGWTAVVRPIEGDLYISLRNPKRLPMTMLWHSNGGRDYPPWNSQHSGCLGVEEGVAWPLLDISRREHPDLLQQSGQASAVILAPDTTTDVRHVTGCIAWPTGEAVRDVQLHGNSLTVTGDRGSQRVLPILGDFLDS